MNTKIITLLTLFAAVALGYFLGKGSGHYGAPMASDGEQEILYWVAPMDSNFRRDQPGKSPMGMDLVPVYAGGQSTDEFSVSISASTTQNLGVRTDEAVIEPWVDAISAVGEIAWDSSKINKVYARAEGWLETLNLNSVGQQLRTGESLYGLYAPQLVTAQEEYLQALRSGNSGQINNSRRRLLALGLTTKQVEQLKQLRKAERLVDQRVDQSSVVLSLEVAAGSYVTPKTEIATLVNTDSVWVEAYLPESDAALVSVGDSLSVSIPAYPQVKVDARVDYVYPELDRATRTVKIRAIIDNSEGRYKAGMFARLDVNASQADALQVPIQSIIRMRDGNRVVVANGDGLFTVKPVRLGAESATSVVVLDGLQAGDRIVTSGQFLLDAEANGQQALTRLDSLKTAEGSATILGFPQRGQIRLEHDPIESLGWPSMNMVFAVSNSVNLMPFNKQDRVSIRISERLDGRWAITAIAPLADKQSSMDMPMKHEGMQHD
jgi:Cu(I)/Ag(I) efflux system membrane fusion protein